MMAPAYTSTWIAPMNCASSRMYSAARLNIVFTSQSAAAMWLVNVMFSLAALYVMMDAQFVGAIQVLVYAGAIMVVFLFVVMLLNLGHASDIADARGTLPRIIAGLLGVVLLALVGSSLRSRFADPPADVTRTMREQIEQVGAVGAVAEPLFREYLLAFEVTSLVLLVAMIGAVVLGKRRTGGETA